MTQSPSERMAHARACRRSPSVIAENEADLAPISTYPVHEAKIRQRLKIMPKSYRLIYKRAMLGKSRKAGIKAFCNECMGWEGLQGSVRACTAPACPLYPYRC